MRLQSTLRQQFVRLCDCGCGQPTLCATHTERRKGYIIGQPLRYIVGHTQRGRHYGRKELIQHDKRGYLQRYTPDHPHANHLGYVYEHRLVMEQALGRYLTPNEEVHHRNENKSDNRLSNLEVRTKADHRRLHWLGERNPRSRPRSPAG